MAPKATPDMASGWIAAARRIERLLQRPGARAESLWEGLPEGGAGSTARALVLGVVRHRGLLEWCLQQRLPRPPRPRLKAALLCGAFELWEAFQQGEAEKFPLIVDHAVTQGKTLVSKQESGLINAVLRRLPEEFDTVEAVAASGTVEGLAVRLSHPQWLIRRWQTAFGPEKTLALLEHDQRPAPVFLRTTKLYEGPAPEGLVPVEGLADTLRLEGGAHWPSAQQLIDVGQAFVQDPGQRHAAALLAPVPGETILDLCAAPGGKALALADALSGHKDSLLVCLDLPGERLTPLRENLARAHGIGQALVEADLLETTATTFREQKLPPSYAGVLLDAPCSNTGVLRRRPEAKDRLSEGEITRLAGQQRHMLRCSAGLVAEGGRLVYSTCSLEAEENEQVVEAFLGSREGAAFTLAETGKSLPFAEGFDGGCAFLLKRR